MKIENPFCKIWTKTVAFVIAAIMITAGFGLNVNNAVAKAETSEITKIDARVHQIDASVQLPYNYASIIGFKLTVKLLKDNTDKWTNPGKAQYCGYGGKDGIPGTPDPADPSGDALGHFACYMLSVFKGRYDALKLNENTYGVENEGDNYEILLDKELSKQEVIKFGFGEGGYVAGFLEKGRSTVAMQAVKKGDTITVPYQGKEALFKQGNPYMTLFGYTSEFDIISVEWITGTPISTDEKEWDTVEKEMIKDIATVEKTENQNGSNYVNIIKPKAGKGPFPIVLWIHGGAWTTSSRTDIILNTTMEYMLAQGYAFVSCEYTLSNVTKGTGEDDVIVNESLGKQMVYDLKLAIRFLRANAEKYNLDASFICAMGESAGAHLSLLLGTTNGSKAHEAADTETMDWKGYSSDVQAIVAYSLPSDLTGDSLETLKDSDYKDTQYYIGESGGTGIYASADAIVPYSCYMMAFCVLGSEYVQAHVKNSTSVNPLGDGFDDEGYEAAAFLSPYCQVNSDTPPMYLIHGEKDAAVTISHAYAMEEKAKTFMDEDKVKTSYWPDAGHVEKKYMDSYAQYTETAKFIEGIRTDGNKNQGDSGNSGKPEQSGEKTGCTKGCGGSIGANGIIFYTLVAAAAVMVFMIKKGQGERQ